MELEERIKQLESTVERLIGVIGVLSNADQYNSALLQSTRSYAKDAYDFLISQDVFHDWNNARQLMKEVSNE